MEGRGRGRTCARNQDRRIPATVVGSVSANLDANADLAIEIPQYTFATPVLGGQATIGLITSYGRNSASLNANLTPPHIARDSSRCPAGRYAAMYPPGDCAARTTCATPQKEALDTHKSALMHDSRALKPSLQTIQTIHTRHRPLGLPSMRREAKGSLKDFSKPSNLRRLRRAYEQFWLRQIRSPCRTAGKRTRDGHC